MLPITATPSVPPNRRVASLTAEPTPALAAGTAPMIASVAGALVRPIPVPRKSIWRTMIEYEVDTETVAVHNKPTANETSPAVTTTLLPMRTASFVPTTEATATDPATGRSRTPVPRGL